MSFVGREEERRHIKEALKEGKNVIVSGKYGMGRTSLVRYFARVSQERWRFVFLDFSQTPGKVCKHLMAELFPKREIVRKHGSDQMSRFRIEAVALRERRKHILVLDNIAKLSARKLNLIRDLAWGGRFQLVAIVERSLSRDDFSRLRARLYPAEVLVLQPLKKREVYEFYRDVSERHGLNWTEGHLKNLAEITGGYPPIMRRIASKELRTAGILEFRAELNGKKRSDRGRP